MASTHRVIVAGSRTFTDYAFFRRQFIKYLENLPKGEIEAVTGRAPHGPDDMVYHFCKWDSYSTPPAVKEFKADWTELGKKAGMVRNAEMAQHANRLFVIHDGKSRGTSQMIDVAREEQLKLKLYLFDPPEEPVSEVLNYRL